MMKQHVYGAIQLVTLLAGLWMAGEAGAAQVACTPTAGFNHCARITYSGGDQSFVVPTGVTSLEIRAWGAAGGGANSAYWTSQGGGGGGGFSTGLLAVSGGQSYVLVVGQGGQQNSTATAYGGGGAGGAGTAMAIGGSGGGYSGIFLTSVSQTNARIIAGGGGGSSPGAASNVAAGGGGGANGGQDSQATMSGRGGTSGAGGAGATTTTGCNVAPAAGGGALLGGAGGGASGSEGGGGGGGGWWGGGGGRCQEVAGPVGNGQGGGGSAYIGGIGVTAASTVAGQNFPSANCAIPVPPATLPTATSGGAGNGLYTSGIGMGGCYGAGGNGEITIQWNTPQITVTKTSVGGGGGFTFTGTNGWASQTITTPAAGGSVAGATQVLTTPSVATTLTETIPATYQLTDVTCSGLGTGGTYTPNLTTGAVAFDVLAMAETASIACTFTNAKRPILRLQKALPSGRFNIGDQFTLTVAGSGGPASVTTTGTGSTATGVATLSTGGVSGSSYTLGEAAAAGADFANYASTYLCTNVLSGGQVPSGSGTSFTITAAAGDDLTCTLTNTRNARADLSVTKTNTPGLGPSDQAADTVVSGATVVYSIVVRNAGPDGANGSILRDPLPSGVTCSTATCGSVSGGAVCPAATGAALLTALQSGAGVAIPTLPSGGALTVSMTCTVN